MKCHHTRLWSAPWELANLLVYAHMGAGFQEINNNFGQFINWILNWWLREYNSSAHARHSKKLTCFQLHKRLKCFIIYK